MWRYLGQKKKISNATEKISKTMKNKRKRILGFEEFLTKILKSTDYNHQPSYKDILIH